MLRCSLCVFKTLSHASFHTFRLTKHSRKRKTTSTSRWVFYWHKKRFETRFLVVSTVHSVLKTAHGHSISKSHGERESKGNGSGSGSSGTTARWRTRTRTWTFVVSVSDKRALRAASSKQLAEVCRRKRVKHQIIRTKNKRSSVLWTVTLLLSSLLLLCLLLKENLLRTSNYTFPSELPPACLVRYAQAFIKGFSRRLRKLCQTSFWHFFSSFHFWWGFEICLYCPFEPFFLRIQHATMCFSLQ